MLCDSLRWERMVSLAEYLDRREIVDWYDAFPKTFVGVVLRAGEGEIEMYSDECSADDPDREFEYIDDLAAAIDAEDIVVKIWGSATGQGCHHTCRSFPHVANFIRRWRRDPEYRHRLSGEDSQ